MNILQMNWLITDFMDCLDHLRNEDRLVLTILQHVMVSVVSNREDMRWHFISSLALVAINDSLGVDWESLVGVDSDTEESRVGLKEGHRGMKHW